MQKASAKTINILLLLALCGYLWLSGAFLTRFPYVHSDEAWLAGLSRAMQQNGAADVTEPFFNLKPRWPHAIKLLFHSLQIIALKLGGYQIGSFRLLSLLAAAAALMLFYAAARRLFSPRREAAIFAAALLAFDVQFIYASHIARQEIFIVLGICASLFLLLRPGAAANRDIFLLSLITALAVGFHPNAFVLACGNGAALLAKLAFKQASVRQIALYIGITGLLAAVFVIISLSFDAQFFSHYAAYAAHEFGLNLSLAERLAEAPHFWRKLFSGISGTYYLPQLRPQMFLFPALSLLPAAYVFAMRREQPAQTARAALPLAMTIGLLAGIMLIGRYNQLSIVFLFPPGWLTVVAALELFGGRLSRVCRAALLALIICCSCVSIKPWLDDDYSSYIAQFEQHIPPGAVTLGNLNSEFAFACGQLLDYRNLAYLDENGLDLAAYLRRYGAEYIVYSAELDFIDENRPYWNIIYGNIDIAALRDFIAQNCELVHEFSAPVYGPRIVELVGDDEYASVKIYRIL